MDWFTTPITADLQRVALDLEPTDAATHRLIGARFAELARGTGGLW